MLAFSCYWWWLTFWQGTEGSSLIASPSCFHFISSGFPYSRNNGLLPISAASKHVMLLRQRIVQVQTSDRKNFSKAESVVLFHGKKLVLFLPTLFSHFPMSGSSMLLLFFFGSLQDFFSSWHRNGRYRLCPDSSFCLISYYSSSFSNKSPIQLLQKYPQISTIFSKP